MQPTSDATANPNEAMEKVVNDGGRVQMLEHRIHEEIAKAQTDLEEYTKNDRSYRRKDTVEVVKDVMTRIKNAITEVNAESEEVRERLYYLIYNATIMIFTACHQLRVSNFSREATHFLAFNVLCLDNNLLLTTAKYIDWRCMNYMELARAYADFGAYKAATKVISYGITKVLYTKQVEEQDPPVPEGTKDTLIDALRVLRTQELKYELQSGVLPPDAWKKKLEETFATNKYHRSLAIVECLQTNEPFTSGEPRNNSDASKLLQIKKDALKHVVELIKPDVTLVKEALVQVHEKKRRDREKKEQLAARDPEVDLDELLDKYKALDAGMIAEKDWKFSAASCPIEIHVELVKLCYECEQWPEFEALLDPALVRLKFRRYEVPYLATVDVLMSSNKTANIPNGFEKLPRDLNQANLRIELKRLRATAKKSDGKEKKEAAAAKEEPKKEEKKAAAPAKGGKPGKDDKKGGKDAAPAEDDKKEVDADEILVTEAELEQIRHIYVHALLQRTKNPQNAIVGLDVVLADENLGPDLPENHYAVAVPIRQHPGSYEKNKLIPYVVFRRTANSLIDEEDSLSIVTDVCVIQGQDPHLRAPLGFTRIDVDLRQTPKDLERVPNLDYVFVCYKTDRQLALAERDLLILRRLAELQKSCITSPAELKNLDEARSFLLLTYNVDLLVDLSSTIKEALLGPLGDYYLEQRRDMLNEISALLWTRYLLPTLQKIDTYVEMRGQKEYFGEFVNTIDEAVLKVRQDFVETLNAIHRILTRQEYVSDIVFYCKCSIYLAGLQEEVGEFRNAVQALRGALGKVVEYREERMKRTNDSGAEDNASTAMSITIDNKKIGELEAKMDQVYSIWQQFILRKERDRVRKEKEQTALDEDEGDEEQAEYEKCMTELRNKDLFEQSIDVPEWQREQARRTSLTEKRFFEESDQIVHALHGDILMNLYRCEIKLGKEMNIVKRQTSDLLKSSGIDLSKNAPGNMTKNLSGQLTAKMNLSKGKTLATNKGALKNLQQTLQEAGKMPPMKPQILSYEKILERENNQNPYQNALLYMALAIAKTNTIEQKSLLLESFDYIKKAKADEEKLSNLALDNAVFLRAARKFHDYFDRSPDQMHPMSLLAKAIYIKRKPVPEKPVMVCRTSTSITMKLPFFKPLTEYKAWRNISEVALYGKPSGSGVAVSLNNKDYEGTGEKKPPGGVVNVTGLIPNERYVFAAGGYTPEGVCVNGIGETSDEILTLLPLSLHQLHGYLAEIAFKLGQYQIARQAAETLCMQFIIKNEFSYAHLDTKVNPILAYRLDENYFSRVSKIEAKQLAESFLILARVSKIVRNEVQRRADHCELKVEKQKLDMKIANFLCIALEISTYLKRPSLTKRVVAELYNHLTPYFTMKMRPQILIHVLLKCHQALRLVPEELIDANTRRILGCLSFQVVRLAQENGEDAMLRRVMISELPITSRKWRRYAQYVVQRPQLTDDEKEKQEEQLKRIEQGEVIPTDELIRDPEAYEERLYKLDEFEDEGHAVEEFLLSLIDYQDVVKAKMEKWKAQVLALQDSVSGGEETIDKLREGMVAKLDFWEQVKLSKPSAQLTALISANDAGNANSRFLEFACKCVRRAMEIGDFDSYDELAEKVNNGVKISEEDEALVESILNERIGYLEKDIVRKQRIRFEALEERVKQMLEQQTLNGGNVTLGPRKLQQLISGDAPGVADAPGEPDQHLAEAFETPEKEAEKLYSFLWVSERFNLIGMCKFLGLVQGSSQRSQLDVSVQSCVFNDIGQLEFEKYKQTLEEHVEIEALNKARFEEEHKEDPEAVYKVPIDDRKICDLLKVMARAAEYAKLSKSWLQLVAIIRYTWNIFSYDLTNPLELSQSADGWQHLLIIAECTLALLEHLQRGGSMRKVAGRDIDAVENQFPSFDKAATQKSVAFKFDADVAKADNGTQMGVTAKEESKQQVAVKQVSAKEPKWFEVVEDLDINLHASLIGFTVQSLMAVQKWESLVDISKRLNDATSNEFAAQLLPFIIYAQSTLYNGAAEKTAEKRKALEVRVQSFENWKLTSKKKRSRQAMLTGEIPPEEQEFNRDKQQLEREIFRLDVIENVLLADKRTSESLLENIKRDANNCVESLKKCRNLYHQFGLETQDLTRDEARMGKDHFKAVQKRKGYRVFTTMVISNYKKTIELLRRRQEKFLLIQALHELGNLLYADGNLGEAEICWNDCVDTIFQRLYVVNQFREVFAANPSLADAFGSKQVIIGGIVLTKLAKLCYEGQDLHKFTECVLMAAELFAAPAKLSMPHPLVACEYARYSFREYLGKDLFRDQFVLQPSEFLHALAVSTQALIDQGLHEKSLPLSALMEYLAADVTRSKVLTVKARLLRAVALVELGYINEAFLVYRRILLLKDLPEHGLPNSDYSQKLHGKNFHFDADSGYFNDLPPTDEKNAAAVKLMLDPISEDLEANLQKFLSPYLVEMLKFVRVLLCVRTNLTENPEGAPESRATALKTAEDSLRAILRKLQYQEEVAHLQTALELAKKREVDPDQEAIDKLTEQLEQTYLRNNVAGQAIKFYNNSEEQMCDADRRSQRLSMMLRVRALLGRVYEGQGMNLESFYVLRQGLQNFTALAEGQYRDVEKGSEPESKGSFKLPDGAAAGGAPAAGKGGAKDAKAAAGKDKGKAATPNDEAEAKRLEEGRAKQAAAEAGVLRKAVLDAPRRTHPSIFLWLKTKVAIIRLLLAQKRYEDCADVIAVTRLEASVVKDRLFSRQLKEIEFQMHVQSGDLREAMVTADEIRSHAQKNHQTDDSFICFLGNLSELMYDQSRSEEASKVVAQARELAWAKIRAYGLEIEAQNINGATTARVWDGRVKTSEEQLEAALANVAAAAPPGGKKDAKGAKDAKAPPKGAPVADDAADADSTETSSLDFSKPIDYKLSPIDFNLNSSAQPPNLYILGLATAIRLDLRYAQYLSLIQKQHEEAKIVLQTAASLVKRVLYLSPQLKFMSEFLLGHVNLQIFYQKMLEFQDKFARQRKYQGKEGFTKHVPYASIALGHFVVELPGFSDKFAGEFKYYLDWAEKAYGKALEVAQNEGVSYEFDFSVIDALREMAECCFLQGEYRERILTYKYADFFDRDDKRRIDRLRIQKQKAREQAAENDDLGDVGDDGAEAELRNELNEQGDKWEEQKVNKESLAVYNYRNKATRFLEAAVQTAVASCEFRDKQHELSMTNLTDPGKIPREIISELYEASQVSKILSQKLPDFEFKDKTSISSAEVLAYLKALAYELSILTFTPEKQRLSGLLSKVHRYLVANLSSYASKCVVKVPAIEELNDAAELDKKEITPDGQVTCSWFDFNSHKSSLFYILGALDPSLRKPEPPVGDDGAPQLTEAERRELVETRNEEVTIHFGKVEIEAQVLSQLYQDARDLIDDMTKSEALSAEKNTRDRKSYKERYHGLIQRLGNCFKSPEMTEEELERDVDSLALVQDIIPELTIENVQKLSQVLGKAQGVAWQDPAVNGILRRFHRVRYVR